MFKQALNELHIGLTITSMSPLLVRDGRLSEEKRKDWSGEKKEVKMRMPHAIPISHAQESVMMRAVTDIDPITAVGKLPFFLPGTSIRGAWRAHLERVLRSQDPPESARVCDPLDDDADGVQSPYWACSAALVTERDRRAAEKDPNAFVPYRLSCPVCRLFGNTSQASRFSISDGVLTNGATKGILVSREHVRIERKTGRVAQGALIKHFGLLGAEFKIEIRLRNFELQHIRLIGALLKDVMIGAVPLGSGKNKGYGQVRGRLQEIRFTHFGLAKPDGLLRGVADYPAGDTAEWHRQRYGIESEAALTLPAGEWSSPTPWRHERMVTAEQFEQLWQQAPLPWNRVPLLKARVGAS